MYKVIKIVENIPLTVIKRMEDDGIDGFERFKMEIAIKIIRELSQELFDRLFQTTITDPRSEEQFKQLKENYMNNPTAYNEAKLNIFRMLKNRGDAEIEMVLKINTD